jgi:hypothetical protein
MLILAETALDRAKDVPISFWFRASGIILAAIFVVILLKIVLPKLAGANKILLCAFLMAAFAIVGFKWIYERDEPAFLTPFVEAVAPFFPTKGAYKKADTKQATPPKGPVPASTPVRGAQPAPDKPKNSR